VVACTTSLVAGQRPEENCCDKKRNSSAFKTRAIPKITFGRDSKDERLLVRFYCAFNIDFPADTQHRT
jgi:hypothetical protein